MAPRRWNCAPPPPSHGFTVTRPCERILDQFILPSQRDAMQGTEACIEAKLIVQKGRASTCGRTSLRGAGAKGKRVFHRRWHAASAIFEWMCELAITIRSNDVSDMMCCIQEMVLQFVSVYSCGLRRRSLINISPIQSSGNKEREK